jgi:cytochrome c oxidase assembly protein subunit 15
LVRLRVLHPVLALAVGFGALHAVQRYADAVGDLGRVARLTTGLCFLQLTLGLINIVMAAPGWMQLLHLFAAEGLWATTVVLLVTAHAEAA